MELRPLAREGEELVAIVFVLLFAGGDLGGQPLCEVMAERIELVEDSSNLILFLGTRERYFKVFYVPQANMRYSSCRSFEIYIICKSPT